MNIHEYHQRLQEMNLLEIVPVDAEVWLTSADLKWDNRDPADRVIVATAKIKRLKIISKDEKIRKFYRYTIW